MEKYTHLIPFLLTSAAPKFSFQRLFEAILIAVLTAGGTMYATQQVIQTELEGVKRDVTRIEISVKQIQRDFYKPFTGNHQ